MRRFKLTPEVTIKGVCAFLFGMTVGFSAFHISRHFFPNSASAKEKETTTSFEKTRFPIKFEEKNEKQSLEKNAKLLNVILNNYPKIIKQEVKQEAKQEQNEENTEPKEEIQNVEPEQEQTTIDSEEENKEPKEEQQKKSELNQEIVVESEK